MKPQYKVIFLLPVIVSCQSKDIESYQMSWMGWTFIIAIGIIISLVVLFKRRFADDAEDNAVKAAGNEALDTTPIGNYVGGHPQLNKPHPDFVFKRNSHCCIFFYSNHSDNPPELRFKIKAGSFRNISVEDITSIENGNHSLPDKALSLFKKKNKDQMALLKIRWMDGESEHTTMFSFVGNDAMDKAGKAKENLLKALN
jgi:hypothetical protein